MDEKKGCKIAALLISVAVVFLSLQDITDWSLVGIYDGCGLCSRLLYPFFHAGIIHALLNVWCMVSVVFIYDVSLSRLIFGYITALSIPTCCLSVVPTVGLSGLVFVLFGSISFEVGRKLYYQLWMTTYLVIGFLFPNTNACVHLYCYIVGLLVALLNKPVKLD